MKEYITLFKNVLDEEACNLLIEKFENNERFHDNKKNVNETDKWKMQFTQINFAENREFEKENSMLKTLFLDAITEYKKEHNIQSYQWPEKFTLEPIRMKRYMPNSNDMFDEHVDVTNHETARRFLVLFIYLNDNFEGGETDFTQIKLAVKPQQGNMILFPPMWNWWHKANPVIGNNPKYIVGTYMHYLPLCDI